MLTPKELVGMWNSKAREANHLREVTPRANIAKRLRDLTALEMRALEQHGRALIDWLADPDMCPGYYLDRRPSLLMLLDRMRDTNERVFVHLIADPEFRAFEAEVERARPRLIEEPMNWRAIARQRYQARPWTWDLLPRPERERINQLCS